VWAAFLGIIFFAEVPDLLTWVGGAIVFGSSFYIAWREAKLRKAKVLSPARSAAAGTSGKQ
ncbi:MAG TPA: EamA/RhaT family transporter, partial [Hyphomicrobiaceae bacterium]|nr:EamA/RhaT family transporter [Hyphomicrobiaceae bacterium]